MAPQQPSDEQLHYQSLISLFKYVLGLMSVFGLFIGFLIYSNGKEMRDDFREQRAELKTNITEMRRDLENEKARVKNQVAELIAMTENSVTKTKSDAIGKISEIKTYSTQIARTQAQNSVNKILNDNNFDEFVSTVAKQRMEPQIQMMVNTRISDVKRQHVEMAIQDILSQERSRFIRGLQTLQLNPDALLSEVQIEMLIDAAKKRSDDTFNNNLGAILLLRPSKATTAYFASELDKRQESESNFTMGTQYFIINNFFDIYNKILLNKMKNNPFPENLFYTAINSALSLNPPFTLKLLDDKNLVRYVKEKELPESYVNNKVALKNSLKKVLGEDILNKTFYFSY